MVRTQHPAGTIVYPEEDGKVSESSKHYKQALRLIEALDTFFAGRADVFVGGNLFVYYQEGNVRQCFSPDVLVALGVRPRPLEERGSYKIWEEGVAPSVIIELTSESTQGQDIGYKCELYATLGVREYYLFDPLGTFLTPRLQGYHLDATGRYARVPGAELDSPALSLRLVVRDGWLRLLNPLTGTLLPILEESEAARNQEHAARLAAEAARNQEHAARLAAEDEVARLRAELARRVQPT